MLKNTLVLLLLIPVFSFCQKEDRVHVIPAPVAVENHSGQFELTNGMAIAYPEGNPDWAMAAEYLAGILKTSTGFTIGTAATKPKAGASKVNRIVFQLDEKKVKHPEGYRLDVRADVITVKAKSAAGVFYAIQTLRQLFPAAINANTIQANVAWTAPACTIDDYPRFGYRGLHLDVGRHWFPVSFVKRYIDLLAMHKLNRFHWHLTEDQGWRIEIKKYPKLQKMAACRTQTLKGHYTDLPQQFDGIPYCHYYTQDEIKEVVEYARQRFVTIVPEIEMPGHALAALTAYPELGCTGGPYETGTKWGVYDDVFCAGNDRVFEFINDVFDEICPLFPGEYMHIGGDECPKTRWKECSKCQSVIKREGLKDEHELQSYFMTRAGKLLEKHGKKMIGWDEILEGGLAPGATVMSWRGIEGGIAAAKAGHDVIMTPGSHCYLDFYQSDPESEPVAIGGQLSIETVYSYEPIPTELTPEEAKFILGAQGNLWTEYIPSPGKVEYMVWPRACALSEVVWSPKERRNWDDFRTRLLVHFPRLSAMKVNYAKSFFDIKSTYANERVTLTCPDPALQIRFTTDGTEPTAQSRLYKEPFTLPQSAKIKAAAWSDTLMMGKVSTVNYFVHKASGKPYTLSKEPKKYMGGETYALTNGVVGGGKTWTHWVGLVNRPIDPVIDFGTITAFNRVTTHFVNNKNSWIHPPKSIEIFVSDDGKNFRSVGIRKIDLSEKMNNSVETVTISAPGAKARYLKLVATSTGVIPEGYPGAGEGAWLFLDEVIVE